MKECLDEVNGYYQRHMDAVSKFDGMINTDDENSPSPKYTIVFLD